MNKEVNFKDDVASNGSKIIIVEFFGLISLEIFEEAVQEFGRRVQALEGKPYRVFIDFMQSSTMKPKIAEAFMNAQNFAVQTGMEKDVFVTKDAIIKMQFQRLAKTGIRFEKLGELVILDNVNNALDFIKS